MEKIYENIKKLRLELGMSQEELARKTGYSDRSSIAKIESGKVDLTNSKIVDFAKALNTTPSALMGWTTYDDLKDKTWNDVSKQTWNSIKNKDDQKKPEYYMNPETAKAAQEIYDDKDLHALFDAARDATPDELKRAKKFLQMLKETNPDG